ncbi:ESX secretion-associated protein EspG [Nocardia sp. alder85J]|uniref:ESX secretion-associated protein EspG n=1 Tax=Nocardia sp. alder85J TaxID=2862949 RepID=UPI001CD1A08A|nr:ESX secretion-associated protein EspG [Nocardia sp. alder85J]MCX4093030.1 ESX secretion-associated protein EspG [Nocardia sp. alder85J]
MTTLTNDGLLALATHLGVQTLPLVLSASPTQDTFEAWTAAQARALADLSAQRLIDRHGDVEPGVATALFVLAQPERELVARIVADDNRIRVCLARRGSEHALAVRRGDSYDIRPIWTDGSSESLARPVLDVLGPAAAADVANLSAPATELSDRLDAADGSSDYTDAVYGLGADERDATAYGLALDSCHRFTELVAYAHADGVIDRSPGAVVVYDTARGRIVAAPGVAADQQIWATLAPGTDHRIGQAIRGLIESLPGGRWLTDQI